MRVVISKETLHRRRACDAWATSPEWDAKEQALVYVDFDKTAKRLMSTAQGAKYLGWLVKNKLVPMTQVQFDALNKKTGIAK